MANPQSDDLAAFAGQQPSRNVYPIKQGWEVHLGIKWADDASVSWLNGKPVLVYRLGIHTSYGINLGVGLLQKGQNELIIDWRNEKNPVTGVHYTIRFLDEKKQYQGPTIDVEIRTHTWKENVVAGSVVYYFPMS